MKIACPTTSILAAALTALSILVAEAATTAARPPAAPEAGEPMSPEERLKRNQVPVAGDIGDGEFRKEQEKGLGGDGEASLRVAQMFRAGSNGVPKDEKRMLQWLMHASLLNNGTASYQLYQYYLEQKLDREAVFFENRAIEQGFTPPPRLDPRRG